MHKRWIWIVIAAQVAWIAGMAASKEVSLARAPLVHLETRPVDPRDLLRGDYVILSYAISQIERGKFRGDIPKEFAGKTVYVALKAGTPFHEGAYASFAPFTPAAGETLLKGKAGFARWQRDAAAQDQQPIAIDYGLERYYVAEGTGEPRGKLTVKAAVDGDGSALIREVLIDGVPYAQAMRAQMKSEK
jgi:uncharacterized membrane-anchored protein